MKIAVVDYKAGNIRNVQKAIESLGAETEVISKPQNFDSFEGIILPGVGSFKNGMDTLNQSGLSKSIIYAGQTLKKPLMGICLGMHLLAEEGDEGGFMQGLGLIPMRVKQFNLDNREERLPHMGWNNINLNHKSYLLSNVPDNSDFYFAHSYHVVLEDETISAAECTYSYTFTAAVEKENIFATQFHPEKSQRFGYLVLDNFLKFCKKTVDL